MKDQVPFDVTKAFAIGVRYDPAHRFSKISAHGAKRTNTFQRIGFGRLRPMKVPSKLKVHPKPR